MKRIISILLSLFISCSTMATVPVDSMISICAPYPTYKDLTSLPLEFNKTNNLTRPINNAFYKAEGEKIIIYGRIMDDNCVPINDAKIFIWQQNKNGFTQHETKTTVKESSRKWMDPNFTGSGTTNSDNLGRFNFITIKPGSNGKITPHIHFMIEHPKLETLHSKIYFPTKPEDIIIDTNQDGSFFSIKQPVKISEVSAVLSKVNEEGYKIYLIDITMSQLIEGKEY